MYRNRICPSKKVQYCPCGGSFNMVHGVKERHEKTIRHIQYLYIPKRPTDDTSTTTDSKIQQRRCKNKLGSGGYYAKK